VSTDFWGRFPRDPRRAENAGLRAADRDREVIFEVLTQSYAEGRLNQLELEERTTAVTSAKTLGELPAIVADLVVPTPLPAAGCPPRPTCMPKPFGTTSEPGVKQCGA
jgi:hypothetical protein